MEIQQYIFVFLVTTFAGMYSLIFGGGSFLTLPTLFLLGIDPKVAIATNQFGAIGQMITGSAIFVMFCLLRRNLLKSLYVDHPQSTTRHQNRSKNRLPNA